MKRAALHEDMSESQVQRLYRGQPTEAYAMKAIPVLLFAIGVVIYIVWKYRGTSSGGQAKHFGLPAGDGVKYWWSCDFDTEISTAAKVSVAAAGLLFGAIASLRPMGASVAISKQGRLAMVVETEDEDVERLLFTPQDGLRIEVLGPGSRKIQGGPSVIVRFTSTEGKSLLLMMHESAGLHLPQWASAAG